MKREGDKVKKLIRITIFIAKVFLYFHGAFFFIIFLFSIIYSFVNPPVTSLIIYRKLFFKHNIRPVEYISLKKIPVKARRMAVRAEDYKFYYHHGIDLEAFVHAYRLNKRIGYTRYGGSTITMQLARTLFLIPNKSYLRKYLESLMALEMDLIMKKDRILELYLNYVEWGEGIFGISAASSFYYKKKPHELSTDELRKLFTILPNPLKYNVGNFWKSSIMRKRYTFLTSSFPG
ncbi:MAG: transglycosylase domain-containing protein [Spirochaetota bacterium]